VLTLVNGTGLGMSSVGGVTLSFLNGKTVVQTTTLTVSAASQYADNVFVRALVALLTFGLMAVKTGVLT